MFLQVGSSDCSLHATCVAASRRALAQCLAGAGLSLRPVCTAAALPLARRARPPRGPGLCAAQRVGAQGGAAGRARVGLVSGRPPATRRAREPPAELLTLRQEDCSGRQSACLTRIFQLKVVRIFDEINFKLFYISYKTILHILL